MGLLASLCEETGRDRDGEDRRRSWRRRRSECRSTVVFGVLIPFVLIVHNLVTAKFIPIIVDSCLTGCLPFATGANAPSNFSSSSNQQILPGPYCFVVCARPACAPMGQRPSSLHELMALCSLHVRPKSTSAMFISYRFDRRSQRTSFQGRNSRDGKPSAI